MKRGLACLIGLALASGAARAASYRATPKTWTEIYAHATQPGDLVLLADGDYPCVTIDRKEVTYRAEGTNAVFACIILQPSTEKVTLEGIVQRRSPRYFGITVRGRENVLRRVTVTENPTHGILFSCHVPDSRPCPDAPSRNLLDHVEVSESGRTGIWIDAGLDNVIHLSRIHHNREHGLLDSSDDVRLSVQESEFDHNGTDGLTHGLYLKGRSGKIQGNRIHDNAGYGLHCWAACYGTREEPYIIRLNRIFGNGSGGTVIWGSASEADPPNDGYPHYVQYQDNEECGNRRP